MLDNNSMAHPKEPISWDFKRAHDFYESTKVTILASNLSSASTTFQSDEPQYRNLVGSGSLSNSTRPYDLMNSSPASLGDFDRLFKHLGISPGEASKTPDTVKRSDERSFQTTPPDKSSTYQSDRPTSSKMPFIQDESSFSYPTPTTTSSFVPGDAYMEDLSRKIKKQTRINKQISQHINAQCGISSQIYYDCYANQFVTLNAGPSSLCQLSPSQPLKQNSYPQVVHDNLSQLVGKLGTRFHPDALPDKYRTPGANWSPTGIHVFIDWSNVLIGFSNLRTKRRNTQGQSQQHRKSPAMSFHALTLVLERGQPVARRILAGSKDLIPSRRQPALAEAERCGYELSLLDKVLKTRDTRIFKAKHGKGHGYATGHSSDSDTSPYAHKTMVEQGVDELLQLKMLQSLIDTENPSTIVLASGDASEAEFSGGFFQEVERFLRKGWNVEVLAWKDSLSHEYHAPAFRAMWGMQFQIIELDDFVQELEAC